MGEVVSITHAPLQASETRLRTAFREYLRACRKIEGQTGNRIGDLAAVVVAKGALRRALDDYNDARNLERF